MMATRGFVASGGKVDRAPRFAFGRNWSRFLRTLSAERIAAAEASLKSMLNCSDLFGRRFLDIGSGSGLFSLAARRLGATVHSFDFDPESVACTEALKDRFFGSDAEWTVERGSVLDERYMRSLGSFDIVYSWGVLHHTGAMWRALDLAIDPVAAGGRLFIALYNRQRLAVTLMHKSMKRVYVASPGPVQWLIAAGYFSFTVIADAGSDLLHGRSPATRYRPGARPRGMSPWYDAIDWAGGYPFESASPDDVFEFCRQRNLTLERLITVGGTNGCNEFVFVRSGA
jgi:2-polyprenyl-6-hydroxyphenyl methylase/3-demethylubiquinone-9 3-methyltransferase